MGESISRKRILVRMTWRVRADAEKTLPFRIGFLLAIGMIALWHLGTIGAGSVRRPSRFAGGADVPFYFSLRNTHAAEAKNDDIQPAGLPFIVNLGG